MSRALLLVGHGSHLNADSGNPVYDHARHVRQRGVFDEVRVAFWKEEPSLARALDGCDADDVTVVPIFMSTGYFTEEIIPREMRLDGPVTRRCGQTVRYTPPIGVHPSLASVIVQRAHEAGASGDEALFVLGHGTPRNPNSERNIYDQTDRVRALGAFPEVATVFLDQEPGMTRVFEMTRRPDIVVVPLFIADGWHVEETIPDDLALDGRQRRHEGRHMRYASAVGTHPSIADVIGELAEEAATW